MRRATIAHFDNDIVAPYFYPRSPCGERLLPLFFGTSYSNFYPRSPCGERLAGPSGPAFIFNFYPRSPCGERLCTIMSIASNLKFLSTLSLRRATIVGGAGNNAILFLSTLSLRRATDTSKDVIKTTTNFYPRSPCGERPTNHDQATSTHQISIHALLAESDWLQLFLYYQGNKFLSTLSLRRATICVLWMALNRQLFLSTLSLRRATNGIGLIVHIGGFLSTLSLRRAT